MKRLRLQNGTVLDLSDAEFAAWRAIFDAIHNEPEPNEKLARSISAQADAVRAALGKPPLGLTA